MKKSILIGLGAVALALGVGAGAVHFSSAVLTEPEEARAGVTNWYIVGSGRCNGKDLAWNETATSSSNDAVQMGEHTGDNAYARVSLKEGTVFKLKYSGGDWKGWNKNLDSNHFEIDSTDNIRCKKSGVYDVYLNSNWEVWIGLVSDKIYDSTLTPTTNRYWFIQNQSSFWGNDDNESFAIHAWNGEVGSDGTNAYYLTNSVQNGSGNHFRYVDLPSDCTKITLVRVQKASSGDSLVVWNETSPWDLSAFPHAQLHCVNGWQDIPQGFSPAISHQAATGDYDGNTLRPGAKLLSFVLVDYPTCTTTSTEVAAVKTNWYDNYDSTIDGTVQTQTFHDYDYETYLANKKHYGADQAVSGTYTVTVAEKWANLTAINSGALALNAFKSSNAGPGITIGLAAFGVAAAGTMIFFAKKRKEI